MKLEWKIESAPVSYADALSMMEERVATIQAKKAPELLWALEHPALYTAGTSAKSEDLVDPKRFPVYQTGRGGEYTYHGPGQRVVYTMLDLKERDAMDVKAYVNGLEEWIIRTLDQFDVKGERRDGRIGIWVQTPSGEAKIAALGIRVRKWVTFHGIAINLNPDLEHFNGIVPCGISEYGVTSLENLGIKATMQDLDKSLKETFPKVFS